MTTTWRQQAAAGSLIPLLLWMLIGGVFAPRSAPAPASPLSAHLSCVCRMCKGNEKTCCCTPGATDAVSAACDGASEDGIGLATAPSILPSPIAVLPLPIVRPLIVTAPTHTETATTRVPVPLLTPPRRLS